MERNLRALELRAVEGVPVCGRTAAVENHFGGGEERRGVKHRKREAYPVEFHNVLVPVPVFVSYGMV
ncbi:hypothetical protein SDC9_187843 [bioreactor metagenome]|uniref:Uncharacterized protein n=1 Tax=bioreactor metagenome TaxID=1076179 RepID=A0A645HMX6_9ZZZZ